jgi:nitrogen fixation protein FixH
MTTIAPNIKKQERTAQLLWTAFVLMFFVLQAILWTVAISITAGDKSHTVVAGYDEQALQWDEVKQLRAESKKLGWGADLKVDTKSDIRGDRVVTLCLKDKSESPVEGASVQLKAYHRGRAAEKQLLVLKAVAPGVYSGTVRVQNSGQWLFVGTASKGDSQFLIDQRFNLNSNRNL